MRLTNTANAAEGDLIAIPIEMIPGTSELDVDFLRQFFGYFPADTSFVISPSSLTGFTDIGGAFLAINCNHDTFFK